MSRSVYAGDVQLLPLEEMMARIELARLEAAPPICPTCDSMTTTASIERHCYVCGEVKPIAAFVRDRAQALGRSYTCKPCHRARMRAYKADIKRRQFRAILGVVS